MAHRPRRHHGPQLGRPPGPGIDVRGSGGYLVGPGSVTAHGRYRLAPGTAHLPPAPAPAPSSASSPHHRAARPGLPAARPRRRLRAAGARA
ncbi:bifunctional DNA primase/polymerase [Streptomyces microflavus]